MKTSLHCKHLKAICHQFPHIPGRNTSHHSIQLLEVLEELDQPSQELKVGDEVLERLVQMVKVLLDLEQFDDLF